MTHTSRDFYRKLTLGGLLTALVIVLQIMGSFIRFGPFSVSLVLIPIVIGAATCGPYIGAWLGFVFGMAVLLSGDAAAFLVISLRTVISFLVLTGFFWGLYLLVPNRKAKHVTAELPGAVLSAAGWLGFSCLYSFILTGCRISLLCTEV